ncbi:MAG: hypothetical protein PHV08_06275, partial [Sulfurovaceae bacterium]|nr:hypothetical protein [Sulfurovaceae bacterium]
MGKLITNIIIAAALLYSSAVADNKQTCTKKVPDFAKIEVCIPQKIDKIIITCYGGASQEIALFMSADK